MLRNDLLKRRTFLQDSGLSLGAIALESLLGRHPNATTGTRPATRPHFKPRAKNVIFLFMAGVPSHLDHFDPKPELKARHGIPVPPSFLEGLDDALIKGSATVMASPRTFQRYGKCGMEFSDFLPHLGSVADELCMVRSMHTSVSNHDPAQLLMQCGVPLAGHPCMGSWVTYGLGSECENLP